MFRSVAAGCALLLVTAACGSGGTSSESEGVSSPGDTQSPPAETVSPTEDASPTDEASPTEDVSPTEDAASATVAVGDSDLGQILVDGEGMSLYMFDPDEQGESTCYDDCATAWPPLTVKGKPVAGEGVDESLLGTVRRDDGSRQVTYDGWPLYLWVQDKAPGDVTGQGVNDVWWAVAPDGAPIRDKPQG